MKRPRKSRLRATFLGATAALGLGGAGGFLVGNMPDATPQTSMTVTLAGAQVNISPSEQFWAASLSSKTQMELNDILIDSARAGNSWRVGAAIEKGADIKARNEWPIAVAALYGQADAVKTLLEQGADVRGHGARTALLFAAGKGHLDVVKVLTEGGVSDAASGSRALVQADQLGHYDVVAYLQDYTLRAMDARLNPWAP
jgi:hypothetical protein